MSKDTTFVYNDVFPSYWPNAVGEYISTLASNFKITKVNSTTIEVVADTDDDQVCIGIKGLMRWNDTTVQAAHPGGSAGTYPIFVTCSDNDVVNTPDPFTDNTVRSFDLKIAAIGGTPAIVPGTVDQFRQVGTLEWDGSAITRIDQTVSAEPYAPTVDEKAALVGTSGTPSSSNKYVTNNDSRNTNARKPVFTWVQNVIVGGEIRVPSGDTDVIPRLFQRVESGHTLKLIAVYYRITSTGSVTFSVKKFDGTTVSGYGGLVADSSTDSTSGSATIDDGEELQVVVSAVSGTPKNLSVGLVFQIQ